MLLLVAEPQTPLGWPSALMHNPEAYVAIDKMLSTKCRSPCTMPDPSFHFALRPELLAATAFAVLPLPVFPLPISSLKFLGIFWSLQKILWNLSKSISTLQKPFKNAISPCAYISSLAAHRAGAYFSSR